jgi:hypothetical protein
MDKLVKEYIEKQESPKKEILLKIREIFLKTLPYQWIEQRRDRFV